MSIGIVLTLLLAVNGLFFYTKYNNNLPNCSSGKTIGNSTIGGDFELIDENGTLVSKTDVINMPVLVYFGYTFCPDICPIDVMRNAEVTYLLGEKGIKIKPIFITIDPDRDTPDVLKEFTDVMHPDMLGLTGSKKQVKAASQAYKTYYKKQISEDEYYLVDHSTFTYFLIPKIGFVDFFKRDETVEKISDTIECHLKKT
ncbi:MAG: SCO family protein [Paracoccaceae bacterium]